MSDEQLLEFLSNSKDEVDGTGNKYTRLQDEKSVGCLIELIMGKYEDSKVMDIICSHMVSCCQQKETKLLPLQIVPALIWSYVDATSKCQRTLCLPIETVLLAIYYLQNSDDNGSKVQVIRIPNLANPSIYHDPVNLFTTFDLSDSAAACRTGREPVTVQIGPFPAASQVNAENRNLIFTQVLRVYEDNMAKIHPVSISTMCKLCSRLCRSGFTFSDSQLIHRVFGGAEQNEQSSKSPCDLNNQRLDGLPRYSLHSSLMLQLLSCVYYAIFNSCIAEGLQALDDLNKRATYDLLPDVLIATNAVISSLSQSPFSPAHDGPMGLKTTELSPVHSRLGPLTNSSIRYKKLPEDITLTAAAAPVDALKNAADVVVDMKESAKFLKPVSLKLSHSETNVKSVAERQKLAALKDLTEQHTISSSAQNGNVKQQAESNGQHKIMQLFESVPLIDSDAAEQLHHCSVKQKSTSSINPETSV